MNHPAHWHPDSTFDGGNTGCGELLLDLLTHMRRQPDGATAAIRTLDDGAPREIPAWCRLTGKTLREAVHPFYLISNGPDVKFAAYTPKIN